MDEERLKKVYEIDTFCWKLIKEYKDIKPLEEEKWDAILNKVGDFVESINDNSLQDFAIEMTTKSIVFLERECRRNAKKQ